MIRAFCLVFLGLPTPGDDDLPGPAARDARTGRLLDDRRDLCLEDAPERRTVATLQTQLWTRVREMAAAWSGR